MNNITSKLKRFINPSSISVHGGSWAINVIEQLKKSGYTGDIWPVHPNKSDIAGIKSFASIKHLPHAPDASFIGVNRSLSINSVRELKEAGAGGVICFASGFSESDGGAVGAATSIGGDLQSQLITAAGEMPLLGPNCYGYLNYLDNVTLWPDQHGGQAVNSGVAIIAQSSNVAINITMQQRGLSLAYMFTVGNQACVGLNELAEYVIEDPRVTTIGLFIEGFADLSAFEVVAAKARAAGKSIVALKLGRSVQAQQATMTHTATLAGGSVASSALLKRLGIVEVASLDSFIETLTFLDVVGPLAGPRISSVSCSGGEASLIADAAHGSILEFPDLGTDQRVQLLELLGEKVTLANPLDYHTYIWGDVPTMTLCFISVMQGDFDLNVFVLDLPRRDRCDIDGHRCAIDAIIQAKQKTDANVVVIASLPENIDEDITQEFHQAGVAVLHGLETAVESITSAILAREYQANRRVFEPVHLSLPLSAGSAQSLTEAESKSALVDYGLPVPYARIFANKDEAIEQLSDVPYPVVLKGLGMEHKSELGGVILSINDKVDLEYALTCIPDCVDGYMVEQMIGTAIAEILVGVTRDDTGLLLLTLGAGGVLTELLSDSVSILMPVNKNDIDIALQELKINALLDGYRGKPAANRDALINSVMAIQAYALDHCDSLHELDVNPLIVREHDCYAVDALIRLRN